MLSLSNKLIEIKKAIGHLELLVQDEKRQFRFMIRNQTDEGLGSSPTLRFWGSTAEECIDGAYQYVTSGKNPNYDQMNKVREELILKYGHGYRIEIEGGEVVITTPDDFSGPFLQSFNNQPIRYEFGD